MHFGVCFINFICNIMHDNYASAATTDFMRIQH